MFYLLLAANLGLAQPTAAEEPSPPLPTVEQITQKLDELYRADSSHGQISMEVHTRNFSRTLQIESWSQGEDLGLMVIRSPAREAGTATLRTEEGLWNYAPRADRLMRIPAGLLSESWMGSHFTNDDLMRESSYRDDYDTVLDWADESGRRLLRATMHPHEDAAVVYTKVVEWLQPEDWLPVRVDYFDGDEIVRRMHFTEIREFSGRRIPAVLVVIPTDKPDESTRIVYESLELDVPIDGSYFTQRGLRKAARKR